MQTIPCTTCGGKGQMPLYPALEETLALVPRKGGITTAELEVRIPVVHANAWSNRLERLHELGLLERTRVGKYWRYSRVTTAKGKRK